MPKLAIYPLIKGLSSIQKRGFQHVLYGKISTIFFFFLRGNFKPLPNKNVHIWDLFVSLLFPKDSESLKILDIWLWEVGAKRRLNCTSKVNRRTHTRTNTRTFRLIESIGPEGRCFENWRDFWTNHKTSFAIHMPDLPQGADSSSRCIFLPESMTGPTATVGFLSLSVYTALHYSTVYSTIMYSTVYWTVMYSIVYSAVNSTGNCTPGWAVLFSELYFGAVGSCGSL